MLVEFWPRVPQSLLLMLIGNYVAAASHSTLWSREGTPLQLGKRIAASEFPSGFYRRGLEAAERALSSKSAQGSTKPRKPLNPYAVPFFPPGEKPTMEVLSKAPLMKSQEKLEAIEESRQSSSHHHSGSQMATHGSVHSEKSIAQPSEEAAGSGRASRDRISRKESAYSEKFSGRPAEETAGSGEGSRSHLSRQGSIHSGKASGSSLEAVAGSRQSSRKSENGSGPTGTEQRSSQRESPMQSAHGSQQRFQAPMSWARVARGSSAPDVMLARYKQRPPQQRMPERMRPQSEGDAALNRPNENRPAVGQPARIPYKKPVQKGRRRPRVKNEFFDVREGETRR